MLPNMLLLVATCQGFPWNFWPFEVSGHACGIGFLCVFHVVTVCGGIVTGETGCTWWSARRPVDQWNSESVLFGAVGDILRPIHLYTDDIDDNTKQQLINLSSLCLDAVLPVLPISSQVPGSSAVAPRQVELLLVS